MNPRRKGVIALHLLRFLAEKQYIFGILDPIAQVDVFLAAHGISLDKLREFGDPAELRWLLHGFGFADECCEELAYVIVKYEINFCQLDFTDDLPLMAKAIGVSEREFGEFLGEISPVPAEEAQEALAS